MKQRVITGIVWGALFLFFVWIGGPPFAVFLGVLSLVGFMELLAMRGIARFSLSSWVGYVALFLYSIHSVVPAFRFFGISVLFAVVALFTLSWTVITKNRFSFDDAAYCTFGLLYLAYGFQAAFQIREMAEGLFAFVLFLLSIWSTDTGAYFVGRTFGGRKLWPEISPKKTISGSVGGSIVAAAICVAFTYGTHHSAEYPAGSVLLFAFIVSVCGQLGDLVESAVKRHYGVKDSGTILPGHGGILDRLDSFVFAAPVAYGLMQGLFLIHG
jgi:phosphatidate cytidylyltransferase